MSHVKVKTWDQNIIKTREYRDWDQDIWASRSIQEQTLNVKKKTNKQQTTKKSITSIFFKA